MMAGTMGVNIRNMTLDDYDEVYTLWTSIWGFRVRTLDDSREGVECFLKRNPTTSMVAEQNGRIVGVILCGHDGRRGCFYHVRVAADYRKHGIGHRMAQYAVMALKDEGINKVSLIAFKENQVGNAFWQGVSWTERDDLNYYDYTLNEESITQFIEQEE